MAIEVDELSHNDTNIDYEIQRQRAIEKGLGCVFIRINPDAEDFILTWIDEKTKYTSTLLNQKKKN